MSNVGQYVATDSSSQDTRYSVRSFTTLTALQTALASLGAQLLIYATVIGGIVPSTMIDISSAVGLIPLIFLSLLIGAMVMFVVVGLGTIAVFAVAGTWLSRRANFAPPSFTLNLFVYPLAAALATPAIGPYLVRIVIPFVRHDRAPPDFPLTYLVATGVFVGVANALVLRYVLSRNITNQTRANGQM